MKFNAEELNRFLYEGMVFFHKSNQNPIPYPNAELIREDFDRQGNHIIDFKMDGGPSTLVLTVLDDLHYQCSLIPEWDLLARMYYPPLFGIDKTVEVSQFMTDDTLDDVLIIVNDVGIISWSVTKIPQLTTVEERMRDSEIRESAVVNWYIVNIMINKLREQTLTERITALTKGIPAVEFKDALDFLMKEPVLAEEMFMELGG
jgi:hypothetical protein